MSYPPAGPPGYLFLRDTPKYHPIETIGPLIEVPRGGLGADVGLEALCSPTTKELKVQTFA